MNNLSESKGGQRTSAGKPELEKVLEEMKNLHVKMDAMQAKINTLVEHNKALMK